VQAHRPRRRTPPPHRRWRHGKALHRRAPSREPPSRTRLSRTGLRTAPERSWLHPFASRACQWPCLRGCAGADPGPGDKSDRLRGAGQALITAPLARTRARGAYLQDAVRTARTAALTPRPSGPMDRRAVAGIWARCPLSRAARRVLFPRRRSETIKDRICAAKSGGKIANLGRRSARSSGSR
jgi:hypothetical protein